MPSQWPSYGEVKFVDVSLRYETSSEPIIKNANIHIKPGQKVSDDCSWWSLSDYQGHCSGGHLWSDRLREVVANERVVPFESRDERKDTDRRSGDQRSADTCPQKSTLSHTSGRDSLLWHYPVIIVIWSWLFLFEEISRKTNVEIVMPARKKPETVLYKSRLFC